MQEVQPFCRQSVQNNFEKRIKKDKKDKKSRAFICVDCWIGSLLTHIYWFVIAIPKHFGLPCLGRSSRSCAKDLQVSKIYHACERCVCCFSLIPSAKWFRIGEDECRHCAYKGYQENRGNISQGSRKGS
jgi:hypothetical protein